MSISASRAGRLVLIWEGVDLPRELLTERRRAAEILLSGDQAVPVYEIGTERPLHGKTPRLWIGEKFGEPTGPAGDPWPLPAGACEPSDAAAAFSELRIRPEQCDAFWLSYFLPDWREVDQDRNPVLVRLALAWSEAMTLSAIVDQAGRDAAGGANWIVRWRFACWWPRTGSDERQSRIAARSSDFLTILSHRAIAATGCAETFVIGECPSMDCDVDVWKWE